MAAHVELVETCISIGRRTIPMALFSQVLSYALRRVLNSLRSTREYTRVDLLDGWGRRILACQLKRFVIEQQLVKRELTTNAEHPFKIVSSLV